MDGVHCTANGDDRHTALCLGYTGGDIVQGLDELSTAQFRQGLIMARRFSRRQLAEGVCIVPATYARKTGASSLLSTSLLQNLHFHLQN